MAGYGTGLYGAGLYGRALTGLVVTEQDVWPPRLVLAATGLSLGDDVQIQRTHVGTTEQVVVRGSDRVDVTDPGLVVVDAEEPFGVALTYTLLVNGVPIDEAGPVTVTLDGDKVALSDAISGLAAEVVVTAWPDKSRTRSGSVFQIAGRNVVVSGQRGQFSSTLEIFTETETARQSLLDLLDAATQGILLLRSADPTTYDGVDAYLVVQGDTESRWSQDGSDERRIWSLDVAEVGPWAALLEAKAFTYADLAATYTGLTYADLAGDYPTYLDLAQADLS